MIIVRVALLSAITGQETNLGVLMIANDGKSNNVKKSSYDVVAMVNQSEPVIDADGIILRKPDFVQTTRTGRLENHPRLSLTIWHLVARMLQNMGYAK